MKAFVMLVFNWFPSFVDRVYGTLSKMFVRIKLTWTHAKAYVVSEQQTGVRMQFPKLPCSATAGFG